MLRLGHHGEMNQYFESVVVYPHTSRLLRCWWDRLQVRCAGQDAKIAVDQIRTISKQ